MATMSRRYMGRVLDFLCLTEDYGQHGWVALSRLARVRVKPVTQNIFPIHNLSFCELFGRTFCALFGIGAISCPTDGRAFRRRVDRFFMYPLQSVDLENSPHLRSKHGSEVEGFCR
jgi:hypothetical protein